MWAAGIRLREGFLKQVLAKGGFEDVDLLGVIVLVGARPSLGD